MAWISDINISIFILKIFIISIYTYYFALKIANIKDVQTTRAKVLTITIIFSISLIIGILRNWADFSTSIIILFFMLSLFFSVFTKLNLGSSFLINIISLTINYILYIAAVFISFIPYKLLYIENEFFNFVIIAFFYHILISFTSKMRRISNGISFIDKNKNNEYFNWMIINVSVIILFLIIILSNYQNEITGKLGIGFIIFAIIMFITIQKSLQLYYKQKLLIQDLEETKKELEDKKQEFEKLEQENLNFSKVSHSIAHKQKSLEHKLNELILKNEIASEIDIKDRINAISKEMQPKSTKELTKTDIIEIDDMLKCMQAECINNKIEFELQISGNIHQMINNYIEKEDLEILLADHIKNAIIAISYSYNSNKSILVRLGIIDGCYGLYIYDSGIEFEIDILEKLGKVPSTTHKESGGTGMGFMNTFDTLKKYRASIIIHEYGQPSKDNYTKVLMIKFDKKNEFKIKSYRSDEIVNKANLDTLKVEEIDNK